MRARLYRLGNSRRVVVDLSFQLNMAELVSALAIVGVISVYTVFEGWRAR